VWVRLDFSSVPMVRITATAGWHAGHVPNASRAGNAWAVPSARVVTLRSPVATGPARDPSDDGPDILDGSVEDGSHR
jgi:hypothetical protein